MGILSSINTVGAFKELFLLLYLGTKTESWLWKGLEQNKEI